MIAVTECAHYDHDLCWNDYLINEIYILIPHDWLGNTL